MSNVPMLLEPPQLDGKAGVLSCPICQEEFVDSLDLRNHMVNELNISFDCLGFLNIDLGIPQEEKTPSDQVECPKCKKMCKGAIGLNQHYAKVHRKKKKHAICKLCGNGFRNKYILRFHVKQVHSQATRVACHLCGEVLYNKYMLPKHLKKAHPNQ